MSALELSALANQVSAATSEDGNSRWKQFAPTRGHTLPALMLFTRHHVRDTNLHVIISLYPLVLYSAPSKASRPHLRAACRSLGTLDQARVRVAWHTAFPLNPHHIVQSEAISFSHPIDPPQSSNGVFEKISQSMLETAMISASCQC